mgnify:CR=1 FL=1
MGDQVEPRRRFIETNAQYAKLDVKRARLSVFASQIHLSQRERPWQRDDVCVDCQGLPL